MLLEVYDNADNKWALANTNANYPTRHHNDGINCLFVDGHGEWRQGDAVPARSVDDPDFWGFNGY